MSPLFFHDDFGITDEGMKSLKHFFVVLSDKSAHLEKPQHGYLKCYIDVPALCIRNAAGNFVVAKLNCIIMGSHHHQYMKRR